MYVSSVVALVALSSYVSGHAVLTSITGANNVTMPGLSVHDGTPRDCASPRCGSEADTSVFQGNSALGKTTGFGTVDAAENIKMFMSGTAAQAQENAKANKERIRRGLGGGLLGGGGAGAGAGAGGLGGLLGGAGGAGGAGAGAGAGGLGGLLGGAGGAAGGATGGGATGGAGAGGLGALLGGGGAGGGAAGGGATAAGQKTAAGTSESMVADTAGLGSENGLPTAAEDGTVQLNIHQVNQDGAGPFKASVDSTSGGASESAFQDATVMDNVAGTAFGSLSGVTTTDFPVKVQIPQGTVCQGSVGGADNVCILRVMNSALAGPFGGSVAFTQTAASQKRALEFRRVKRSRVAMALEA